MASTTSSCLSDSWSSGSSLESPSSYSSDSSSCSSGFCYEGMPGDLRELAELGLWRRQPERPQDVQELYDMGIFVSNSEHDFEDLSFSYSDGDEFSIPTPNMDNRSIPLVSCDSRESPSDSTYGLQPTFLISGSPEQTSVTELILETMLPFSDGPRSSPCSPTIPCLETPDLPSVARTDKIRCSSCWKSEEESNGNINDDFDCFQGESCFEELKSVIDPTNLEDASSDVTVSVLENSHQVVVAPYDPYNGQESKDLKGRKRHRKKRELMSLYVNACPCSRCTKERTSKVEPSNLCALLGKPRFVSPSSTSDNTDLHTFRFVSTQRQGCNSAAGSHRQALPIQAFSSSNIFPCRKGEVHNASHGGASLPCLRSSSLASNVITNEKRGKWSSFGFNNVPEEENCSQTKKHQERGDPPINDDSIVRCQEEDRKESQQRSRIPKKCNHQRNRIMLSSAECMRLRIQISRTRFSSLTLDPSKTVDTMVGHSVTDLLNCKARTKKFECASNKLPQIGK